MPALYAHYRFGMDMLRTMPPAIQKSVQAAMPLYISGLFGPDIFHYNLCKQVNLLASYFHGQTGSAFFSRCCQLIRQKNTATADAYLYGLLCHYCLDSVVHSTVNSICKDLPEHILMEGEFERYLLALDQKPITWIRQIGRKLPISRQHSQMASQLYSEVTPDTIRMCLQIMGWITQIGSAPPGPKRILAEKVLLCVSSAAHDTMIPIKPVTKFSPLNPLLLQHYQRACEIFPAMLQSLYAHRFHSTPLSPEFEPIFG